VQLVCRRIDRLASSVFRKTVMADPTGGSDGQTVRLCEERWAELARSDILFFSPNGQVPAWSIQFQLTFINREKSHFGFAFSRMQAGWPRPSVSKVTEPTSPLPTMAHGEKRSTRRAIEGHRENGYRRTIFSREESTRRLEYLV